MNAGTYKLNRPAHNALEIVLCGELDRTSMLAVEHDVRTRLRAVREESLRVLVDLRGVIDYSLEGRELLVRTLRHVAARSSRVTYVAEGAGPRALALWADRMATPGTARVTGDALEAQQWLCPERSGVHAIAAAADDDDAADHG